MRWMLAPACWAAMTTAAAAAIPPVVEVGDWTFVGHSDTTMMFIKPEDASPGAVRRVRVRFEEAVPFDRRGFASMSNVEIDEVDCLRQMTRVVEDTRYLEHNMKGDSRVDRPASPEWKPEKKDSFGAAILKAVCGDVL